MRSGHEPFVTPWPVARTNFRIFRNFGCALALARWWTCRIPRFRRGLRPCPTPYPVPLALRLAARFPLFRASIDLSRTPAPPATSLLPTVTAAIPALRSRRLKPAWAALQQAPPGTWRSIATLVHGVAALTSRAIPPKVQWVHGSVHSLRIKPREEADNSFPGRFLLLASLPQRRCRGAPRQIPVYTGNHRRETHAATPLAPPSPLSTAHALVSLAP